MSEEDFKCEGYNPHRPISIEDRIVFDREAEIPASHFVCPECGCDRFVEQSLGWNYYTYRNGEVIDRDPGESQEVEYHCAECDLEVAILW